jgi:hypothetical protein
LCGPKSEGRALLWIAGQVYRGFRGQSATLCHPGLVLSLSSLVEGKTGEE